MDLLREHYQRSLPIIREQFLNEMLRHPVPEDVAADKLLDYGVNILGAMK